MRNCHRLKKRREANGKPIKVLHMNSHHKPFYDFKFDGDEDENASHHDTKENINISPQSTY